MKLSLKVIVVVLFGILVACLSVTKAQTECSTDSDCNNGICESLVCNCTTGYVTYNNETCNYKQKSQKTVYWISVLVGNLGADWFYLANGNNVYIIVGCVKLIFGLGFYIGIFFFSFYKCCSAYKSAGGGAGQGNSILKIGGVVFGMMLFCFVLISILTTAVWSLVDICRIYMNVFMDGNGVSLIPWSRNPWW